MRDFEAALLVVKSTVARTTDAMRDAHSSQETDMTARIQRTLRSGHAAVVASASRSDTQAKPDAGEE